MGVDAMRLRARTRTERAGVLGFSVRGLFSLRSIYVRLPFGYRWEIWKRSGR